MASSSPQPIVHTQSSPTVDMPHQISLADLTLGTTMHHITVRILRMWEARNFKRNGELMSLDALLIDNKDCLIQASIHHRRVPHFQNHLHVGKVYSISNFEVVPAYERYKVTDNVNSIRFMDSTEIKEDVTPTCPINAEMFRLLKYSEYLALANTNIQLPDVVGQILSVQGSNLQDSTSNQKIVMLLLLEGGTTVRVTIWDQQASEFRKQFHLQKKETLVVVCTCVNPKLFAGTLYLNTTGSTHFYFDPALQTIHGFRERMGLSSHSNYPSIGNKQSADNKLDSFTITALLDYVSSSVAEEKEVICRATVTTILPRNGWNYVACGKCSKKLIRGLTSFTCTTCNNTNAVGVLKFRVDLVVEADRAKTNFVIFDRDARRLTNQTAEDLTSAQESVGGNVIHDALVELVGKSFDFQLKITKYNLTSSYPSFTVTRVLRTEDPPITREPTSDRQEEKQNAAVTKTEAAGEKGAVQVAEPLQPVAAEIAIGGTEGTGPQPISTTKKNKKTEAVQDGEDTHNLEEETKSTLKKSRKD